MSTLRIAFAGTPEFALPALHALIHSRHRVVGVLTQPDRPKGRGRHLAASPVKLAAQSFGLPLLQPPRLAGASDRASLEAWAPDLLVVVAYGLLLPPAVLRFPPLGCVNIHASLLPRWRGAAPIQRAILAGDSETGVTIMLMDEGLDTGPVLLQRRQRIGPEDTSRSLHDRLGVAGAAALMDVIEAIASNTARSTPQAEDGVLLAPKISKSEARIDWTEGADAIDRRIRAFDPWPIAETRLGGEQLRVHRAHLVDANAEAATRGGEGAPIPEPGSIVGVSEQGLIVRCGRGHLVLAEVQRAGGRPVAAVELARSRSLLGSRLG